MLKKLKGAKRHQCRVRFLVHWSDPDDPDDYTYCYGSIAKRLYSKNGKVIITEQKSKIRRNGSTKSEQEKIIWEGEAKDVQQNRLQKND